MNDEKIVDMYLKRDETAIKNTAEKYGARLKSISYKITSDYHIAQECENDTYLKAWNSIPPEEPRTYLFAFLAKIIRNLSLDVFRGKNAKKRSAKIVELTYELEECIASSDSTESAVDEKLLGESVGIFLRRLSKEKRMIFLYRYFYCETVKDIARRFSLSESNIKTTLFRLRNELKKYLIKEGYKV